MTIQIRPANAPHVVGYCPTRDLLHVFPHVVGHVEQVMHDDRNPFLASVLEDHGTTEGDLAAAVRSYCLFLNEAHRGLSKAPEEALEDCGWFEVPEAARLALYFWLGAVVTGSFFQAVRQFAQDSEAVPEIRDLMAVADRVQEYAQADPERRRELREQRLAETSRVKSRYTVGGL